MRNRIDYYKYFMKFNLIKTIMLFVDTAVVILACKVLFENTYDMIDDVLKDWALLGVIGGSIIKFLFDAYLLFEKYKEYSSLKYGDITDEKIDIGNLQISALEEKFNYKKVEMKIDRNKKDYIIKSDFINQIIRENNLTLEISKTKEVEIKNFIREERERLFPFLQWQYRQAHFLGKGFFNDKKLCLAKDIIPNNAGSDIKITVSRGSYYDTYLTNIISGREMRSNQDDSQITSAIDLFPRRIDRDKEHLKTIAASMMNNEIGVSTIGITADMYLVLWTQNRSAQSSDGLLVPTGSGSCDWKDIRGNNFKKTIEDAMQRELWEESGGKILYKSSEEIGETKLLGFFRWIVKGGKPEFVGITKLKCDLIGLTANKDEVYNRYEVEVRDSKELKAEIEKILISWDKVSVPLKENLQVILDMLNAEDIQVRKGVLQFLGYEE